MDTTVIIYSIAFCPYCTRAKALLEARGIEYTEISLNEDIDGQQQLVARSGLMTFPQIFEGEVLIGGFQELARADQRGELDHLQ